MRSKRRTASASLISRAIVESLYSSMYSCARYCHVLLRGTRRLELWRTRLLSAKPSQCANVSPGPGASWPCSRRSSLAPIRLASRRSAVARCFGSLRLPRMFSVMSLGRRGRLYFSWIAGGSRNRTDQLPLRDSIMIPGPMSLSDCGDGKLNPSTRLGGDLRVALPTALP